MSYLVNMDCFPFRMVMCKVAARVTSLKNMFFFLLIKCLDVGFLTGFLGFFFFFQIIITAGLFVLRQGLFM